MTPSRAAPGPGCSGALPGSSWPERAGALQPRSPSARRQPSWGPQRRARTLGQAPAGLQASSGGERRLPPPPAGPAARAGRRGCGLPGPPGRHPRVSGPRRRLPRAGPGPLRPRGRLPARAAGPAVPSGGAGGAAEPLSPALGGSGAGGAERCGARCCSLPVAATSQRPRPWASRAARFVPPPPRRRPPPRAAAAEPHGPGPAPPPLLLRAAKQTRSPWSYKYW